MTLAELRQEVFDRGFGYYGDTATGIARMNRWLNDGYTRDICDTQPWPFLQQTATGPAPLPVGALRDVLYVTDTTNGTVLSPLDIRDLVDLDPSQSATGAPDSYVIDPDESIRVYPASDVELQAVYIGVPAELDADSDTPVIPSRFHGLIVDAAVIRAYRDDDNFDAAQALAQTFAADLAAMTDAMFSRNLDDTQYVQRTLAHDG